MLMDEADASSLFGPDSPQPPGGGKPRGPRVSAEAEADAAEASQSLAEAPHLLTRGWIEQVAHLRQLLVGIPWILLRIWNCLFLSPNQDIKHYFDAASGMVARQIPYADFASEYPPGALPFFALPRLLTADFGRYGQLFAAEMLLVDATVLWLLARLSHRLHGRTSAALTRSQELTRQYALTVAQLTYVLLVGSLGYLAFERYDLLFAALLLGFLDQAIRPRRRLAASVLLGLSIAVKLVSVVLVPLYAAYVVAKRRAKRKAQGPYTEPTGPAAVLGWQGRLAGLVALQVVGCAAAIMLPFYAMAGHKFFSFVAYHRERGVQIESLYASVMLCVHHLSSWLAPRTGLPVFGFGTRFAYGATEAYNAYTPVLASLAGPLLVGVTTSLCWRLKDCLWAQPDAAGRDRWLVRGTLTLVLALLSTNKVFSPQYMLWLSPLLACLLLTDVRALRPAVFAVVLANVLTSLILFFYYIDLLRLAPMADALLLTRNLLVVAACGAFAGLQLRWPPFTQLRALCRPLARLERHPALLWSAFGLTVAWVLLANLSETTANDIWIQLRSGEDIVRSKTLPYTEVYSATVAGRPFIAHEWLCGVLFYASTLVFGDAGLSIITALVAVGIFLAMYATFPRPMRQTFWYMPLLVYLNYLVAFRLLARPHIFTILAQALMIMAIEQWRRDGKLRRLVWLLPMQVVWINLHGAALFGPALMGMLAGYVTLSVLWPPLQCAESRRFHATDAKQTIGMTLGLAGACLVNPYTWRIVAFSLDLMGNEYAKNRVWEWTTPFMRMNMYYFWLWIWLIAVVGLWSSLLLRARQAPVLDAAYAVLATYLGQRANRFMPDFALLAFPVIARSLYALSTQGLVPAARRRFAWLEIGTAALLLCNCVVYGYAHSTREHRPLPGVGYGGDMPYDEVALLKKLGVKGTIYNEYSDGSLIINRLWPAIRPVLDSRIDLYPLDLVNDYDTAYTQPQAFAQYLKKRNINVVMLYRNRAHPGVIRWLEAQPQWRRLSDVNNRVLFVTRDSLRRSQLTL